MLTVYFTVLVVAMCAAYLTESSRPAVMILAASWAVSFLSEMIGLRDMAVFIDAATFWGMVWCLMKHPTKGAVSAAHFIALMIGTHFVFELTYRLGWYVPGLYMWTLNGLYMAAVFSLIGAQPKPVRVRRRAGA
jgi:hypothetical protein